MTVKQPPGRLAGFVAGTEEVGGGGPINVKGSKSLSKSSFGISIRAAIARAAVAAGTSQKSFLMSAG